MDKYKATHAEMMANWKKLEAGEEIVVAGQMKLYEGASVQAAGTSSAAVN